MNISVLDIILVIPLAYGLLTGYRHGLVREVASLLGFVVAMYFARYLSGAVGELIGKVVAVDANVANIVAFAAVFVAVMAASGLLSKMLTKLLKIAMLGTLNRLCGAVFAFVKYLLMLGALIYLAGTVDALLPMVDVEQTAAVKNSRLYEPVRKSVGVILPYLHLDELTNLVSVDK